MTGRLSRAQREALARQDTPLLVLPLLAGNRHSTDAHLRHMVRLLRNRQAVSPSANAVTYINDLFDRTVPEAARVTIACRKGCSYCCTQPVLTYGPEAFFVASQLRSRPETASAVQEAERKMRGREPNEYANNWMRCPLLDDGVCSIYASRPLSCHAYVSMDVNDCIGAFLLRGEPRIRSPEAYNSLRNLCRIILVAALRLCGLPEAAYEMNAAVSAVMVQENAEKRWLRGENIFEGLQVRSLVPPEVETVIVQIVAAIAPTL